MGAVGVHEHALLHLADQLRQGARAGLQVDVGHAVDGRTVPVAGTGVGGAGEARSQFTFKDNDLKAF